MPCNGRRPRRLDDPAGSRARARRGVVHQGLLPRSGARLSHRQPWSREPLPASPRRTIDGELAAASAPRSCVDDKVVGAITSVGARRRPRPRSATCAARSSRRARSSCAGRRPSSAPSPLHDSGHDVRRLQSTSSVARVRDVEARAFRRGRVTTKRVPSAGVSTRRGRRPWRRRARARWRGRCPVPTRAARARCATCRAGRTRAAGRPGRCRDRRRRRAPRPRRRPAARRRRRARRANFSAFSTRLRDDLREALGVAGRPAPVAPVGDASVTPISVAAGWNASTALATTARGVDRLRAERELAGVEASEIEEVGDEPFEPARLRRDHLGGAASGRRGPRRCRRRSPRRSRGST